MADKQQDVDLAQFTGEVATRDITLQDLWCAWRFRRQSSSSIVYIGVLHSIVEGAKL